MMTTEELNDKPTGRNERTNPMTDLISRAAAAAICDKHSYSNNQYVSMRMIDAAREIHALPAAQVVDPAQISDAALQDPIAVHANMLRGTIAMPSVANIIHLYGAGVLRSALIDTPPAVSDDVTAQLEAINAIAAVQVMVEQECNHPWCGDRCGTDAMTAVPSPDVAGLQEKVTALEWFAEISADDAVAALARVKGGAA